MGDIEQAQRELIEEFDKGVMEMLEELDLDQEGLAAPSGAIGLAVFAVTDEETGLPAPAMMLSADYGAEADQTAELLQAILDKGEEEGALSYEEIEVQGRTAMQITMIEPEGEDDEALDMGGMNPMASMPDPSEMIDRFNELIYLN